jgi:hypothetical protein
LVPRDVGSNVIRVGVEQSGPGVVVDVVVVVEVTEVVVEVENVVDVAVEGPIVGKLTATDVVVELGRVITAQTKKELFNKM